MDTIDKIVIAKMGPWNWHIPEIYNFVLQKYGPCANIGVGYGINLFTNYLINSPFYIVHDWIVKTNISCEDYKKILAELNFQQYFEEVANKNVSNTPENSVILYLQVSMTEWKYVLVFKNQGFNLSDNRFHVFPYGFHLKTFITEFQLEKVLKQIIKFLLKHNGKICSRKLNELHNYLQSCDLQNGTKKWLSTYGGESMIFTIIRLFTQAFKVTDDLIQLKSMPEAFPSDGRLCLEILKVQENTMTLPEIYRKLPDFCRSRISNLSDLENFFERFPDFLDPPPKIPNNKSDWDHIKNELSSLNSVVIRIIDEES